MENKEYYTPTIEEIYSGYEYEVKDRNGEWRKVNEFSNDYDYEDNPHYAIMLDIDKGNIRVPYLCKQDIIDCGFSYNEERDEFIHPKTILGLGTGDDKKVCIYQYKTNVLIYTRENRGTEDTLFDGFCKSKNELKKLMKDYLNIPI